MIKRDIGRFDLAAEEGRIRAREGCKSTQHAKRYDAETPHVDLFAVVLLCDDLRRSIPDAAAHVMQICIVLVAQMRRNSKVDEYNIRIVGFRAV